MLTERQEKLLRLIIESYIRGARPIASELLVKKISTKVSSATVRHDMVGLEQRGYIAQPHTSAGRVPTVKAYEYYVQSYILVGEDLRPRNINLNFKVKDLRFKIKEVAKWLARESQLAVIVGFGRDDNYYTGLSRLFSAPEFSEQAAIVNISALIEKFDIIVKEIYPNVRTEPGILIGHQGQFGRLCSFVAAKVGPTTLISILGPIRMDYKKNYQLIKLAVKLINE